MKFFSFPFHFYCPKLKKTIKEVILTTNHILFIYQKFYTGKFCKTNMNHVVSLKDAFPKWSICMEFWNEKNFQMIKVIMLLHASK